MTNNFKKIVLRVFLLACLQPMVLLAQQKGGEDPSLPFQPVNPSVPNEPSFGGDPDNVPIDGGVGILLAAGVTYGLKKIYDNKRKNKKV